MKACIIIVSDSCAKDRSLDATGPKLEALFSDKGHQVIDITYERDEKELIKDAINNSNNKLGGQGGGLIVTSGGTGFSPNDYTPEAVLELIDCQAYGLVHAMMKTSLEKTPMAALSRPVAGIIGKNIIITVPGSPKGAVECVGSIIDVIPHALALAAGENSRKLHQDLDRQATSKSYSGDDRNKNNHCDHHHRNDHTHRAGQKMPRFYDSPVKRPRESPYEMIPVQSALNIILDEVPERNTEEKPLLEAMGHVISKDIKSEMSVPPYRTSIVDGYAVGDYEFPGSFQVSAISHAGMLSNASQELKLQVGTISRITTGARVPSGVVAVIPVENTVVEKTTADNKEEEIVRIDIHEKVQDGDNIRELGSDVATRDIVLSQGTIISPIGGEIGIAASVGLRSLPVFSRPIIGIMSTGNELLDIDQGAGAGTTASGIFDSNRPSLMSICLSHGFEVVDVGIAGDTMEQLKHRMEAALKQVDVLITTGGVSMGETDLLKPCIEQELQGTIHFGRVAMKPGKPMTFATIDKPKKKLIFSLPGNPASGIVTFHLFVLPAIRYWSGYSRDMAPMPRVKVKLESSVALDPRPEYHRVYVQQDENGVYTALSTGGQRSSRVGSLVGANALLCLPPKTEAQPDFKAGSLVEALLMK